MALKVCLFPIQDRFQRSILMDISAFLIYFANCSQLQYDVLLMHLNVSLKLTVIKWSKTHLFTHGLNYFFRFCVQK